MSRRGVGPVVVAWAAGAAVWLATASPAAAQVDISVHHGDEDIQSIPVSSVLNGLKTRRAESGADGEARVASGVFPQGTEVDVYKCPDGEIVLAGPGEDPPCDGDDELLGAFAWRDGTSLSVDIGAGLLEVTAPTTTPAGTWSVGAGVDLAAYTNFEDVACDLPGLESCSGDSAGYAAVGSIEYLRGAWGLGLEVGYGMAPDVTQTVPGGTVDIGTDVVTVTPMATYWPHPLFGFSIGAMWLRNMTDLTLVNGTTETIERDATNVNAYLRGEASIPLSLGLRLGFGVGVSSSFGSDDADSPILIGLVRAHLVLPE